MSDFTKKELVEMLLIFNESIAESTQPESTHILRDKIQAMVNSYNDYSHKLKTYEEIKKAQDYF